MRTELFDYAREIGVMIAHLERGGYQDIRIARRQYDVGRRDEATAAGIE